MLWTLKRCVAAAVNAINRLVPKKRGRVLFCDAHFRQDNVWALMETLSEPEFSNFSLVYYTRTSKRPGALPDRVRWVGTPLAAFFAFFSSAFVFWAYEPVKLFLKPTKKQTVVNLWHGSPLKDCSEFADTHQKFAYRDNFSYVLSASPFFDEIIRRTFACDTKQILTLGAPRNDWLFSDKDVLPALGITPKRKAILWMPTFRQSGLLGRTDSDTPFPLMNQDTLPLLNEMLAELDMWLIIKPHPAAGRQDFSSLSHVLLLYNENLQQAGVQTYELLGRCDLLLTDYSSVYFDFLLTQKPIGFVFDDFDSYKERRGFMTDDPSQWMPGQICSDLDGLLRFLREFAAGMDHYAARREECLRLFNAYTDNSNRRRLLEKLELL